MRRIVSPSWRGKGRLGWGGAAVEGLVIVCGLLSALGWGGNRWRGFCGAAAHLSPTSGMGSLSSRCSWTRRGASGFPSGRFAVGDKPGLLRIAVALLRPHPSKEGKGFAEGTTSFDAAQDRLSDSPSRKELPLLSTPRFGKGRVLECSNASGLACYAFLSLKGLAEGTSWGSPSREATALCAPRFGGLRVLEGSNASAGPAREARRPAPWTNYFGRLAERQPFAGTLTPYHQPTL